MCDSTLFFTGMYFLCGGISVIIASSMNIYQLNKLEEKQFALEKTRIQESKSYRSKTYRSYA